MERISVKWCVYLLTLVLGVLCIVTPALAAGDYYGTVLVSNNSTAQTSVSTNLTGADTAYMVSGNFLNSSANDTSIESGGTPIPIMPGYGGNPWTLWVSSIGDNTSLQMTLLTGVTTGKIRIFGSTQTSDNSSLEPSANYTEERSVYLGSSSGNFTYKQNAIVGKWNPTTGNVTYRIGEDEIRFKAPSDAQQDYDGAWATDSNATDNDTGTNATHAAGAPTGYIGLSWTQPFLSDAVRFYFNIGGGDPTNAEVDVYVIGTGWTNVYNADPATTSWITQTYNACSINGTRIRVTSAGAIALAELQPRTAYTQVSASGIAQGEHTVNVGITGATTPTTVSVRVNSSSDDIQVHWTGAAWNASLVGGTNVGYISAVAFKYGNGNVFDGITIPRDSVIVSANMTVKSQGAFALNDVNSRITGELTNSAATFSTLANYQGRTHTTANVSWDAIAAFVDGTTYNSPELSSIIQEITDQAGWQSGNNIALFWEDHEGRSTAVDGTRRAAYSYDTSSANASLLNVTYYNSGNLTLTIDGVMVATVKLPDTGFSVPNNSSVWTDTFEPYGQYVKRWVGGNLKQFIVWEYGATLSDQSGNLNNVAFTPRTTSSSASVNATLVNFYPVVQPTAPAWSVGTGPDFLSSNFTISANFTANTTAGKFIGQRLLKEVTEHSATPQEFPLVIIFTFGIVMSSIIVGSFMRDNGAMSVLIKLIVIFAGIGLARVLQVYMDWNLVLMGLAGLGIVFASTERRLGR